MPGPAPKRSEQRRRRNKDTTPVTSAAGYDDITIPDADPEWHPTAKRWYNSLAVSGQQAFYQNSDWAMAYFVAEAMSKNLCQPKFSAVLFQAVISAAGNLLTTEGDRRRLKIELTTSPEDTASDDASRRLLDLVNLVTPKSNGNPPGGSS